MSVNLNRFVRECAVVCPATLFVTLRPSPPATCISVSEHGCVLGPEHDASACQLSLSNPSISTVLLIEAGVDSQSAGSASTAALGLAMWRGMKSLTSRAPDLMLTPTTRTTTAPTKN